MIAANAKAATIVLPEPTSPWTSLDIEFDLEMSFNISSTTLICALVRVNGSDAIAACSQESSRNICFPVIFRFADFLIRMLTCNISNSAKDMRLCAD